MTEGVGADWLLLERKEHSGHSQRVVVGWCKSCGPLPCPKKVETEGHRKVDGVARQRPGLKSHVSLMDLLTAKRIDRCFGSMGGGSVWVCATNQYSGFLSP